MPSRRALALLLLALPLACSRPSADDCHGALAHLRQLLADQAASDLAAMAAKNGVDVPPEVAAKVPDQMRTLARNLPSTAPGAAAAMEAACRSGDAATAKCVREATSVDELVRRCQLKSRPGARGGVLLSWPD